MQPLLDVAVLSPTPSHPLDYGNRKRVNALCRALRTRGARIHFILYPLEADWRAALPEHALAEMRATWDEVHVVPPSVPLHPRPTGLDHTIDEWWDPGLDAFLSWYCERRPLDALLVNYVYLSKGLLHARSSCLKVLDTHDRVAGRRERLAKLGLAADWFHTTVDEEAKGVSRADLALAIKAQEEDYFKGLNGPPILTVPYIEERRDDLAPTEDVDGFLRIGLLGANNNINVSSTVAFLEYALPRFREFMAPIKIILAGSMCPRLAGFAAHDGVEVLGPVNDIRTFYERVDVMVGVVEESTGQKIRIGEALGFGCPVISHAHTFEGYPSSHRWHRLEDGRSVVDACIELAFDRSLLAALGEASRESHRRQAAEISTAVDTLARQIARSRPANLFIVDPERLRGDPLLVRHIASMIYLVAEFSKVLVLVQGDPNEDCAALVRLVRTRARTWATEAAADRLELPDVRAAPSARALTERFRVGNIWLFGASADAVAPANCATVTTSGVAEDGARRRIIGGYVHDAAGMARFGRLVHSSGGATLRGEGILPIPMFPREVPENLIGGPLFIGRPAVAILVSPETVDFALALAALIVGPRGRRTHRRVFLVAGDEALEARLTTMTASGANARGRWSVVCLRDPDLYEPTFELVVDLAPVSGEFDPMLEYLSRRGVPALRAPIDGQPAETLNGRTGRLAFVMQVLRALNDSTFRTALADAGKRRDDAAWLAALSDRLRENAGWAAFDDRRDLETHDDRAPAAENGVAASQRRAKPKLALGV